MRLKILMTIFALCLFATGCASSPEKVVASDVQMKMKPGQVASLDRTPDAIEIRHNSIRVIGGMRFLNFGVGRESMMTILQAQGMQQPMRAKCIPSVDHSFHAGVQIEYGEDSGSKTLDLHSAVVVVALQSNMAACLVMLDKLLETTQFYPAYINFGEGRKVTISF